MENKTRRTNSGSCGQFMKSSPLITVLSDTADSKVDNSNATDVTSKSDSSAEVFVDAPFATPARADSGKPNKKRKKVVISNSSDDTGSLPDSDDGEDDDEGKMEEGECDKSASEQNVSTMEKTLLDILKECKSLRDEVDFLKKEREARDANISKIVKDTIQKEKVAWMDEVVSLITNDSKFVDKTVNVQTKLKQLAQENQSFPQPQVTEKVFERINTMEDKMVDLEARSRRNNLIFHGIEEANKEDCRKTAYDAIEIGCEMDPRGIRIERAHRIGRRRPNATKPRPLIVRFLDFHDKENVKDCRRNLPPNIHVSDDYPYSVREMRRRRMPELIAAKNNGKQAFLRYPATLIVDGQVVGPAGPAGPVSETATARDSDSRRRHQGSQQEDPENPWFTADRSGRHNPPDQGRGGQSLPSRSQDSRDPQRAFDDHHPPRASYGRAPYESLDDRDRRPHYNAKGTDGRRTLGGVDDRDRRRDYNTRGTGAPFHRRRY